jgi:FkbM family methyltransferase
MSLFKRVLSALWFRPGSAHRILSGPMRGMKFHFSENSSFAALYSGNEKDNQKVYASVVRRGDTVVDAGANWGVHSLYLAHLVGSTGRVHAFEPHPQVNQELRSNIQLNALTQVTVHQMALSDHDGIIPFHLAGSSKESHILDTSEHPDAACVEVRACTLDQIASDLGLSSLRLLKVDVEGAEGPLLRGSTRTIERFRPHLVVELHNPEQDLAVGRLLSSWNYQLFRVDGTPVKNTDRAWPDPDGVWGTLHAIPR